MESTVGMLWLQILGNCIPHGLSWRVGLVHQELLLLLLPNAGQRVPAD